MEPARLNHQDIINIIHSSNAICKLQPEKCNIKHIAIRIFYTILVLYPIWAFLPSTAPVPAMLG